ncbi:E protein [Olivier's shrew virus 3]|nr:E protein [Olivier's shrew virus 3]
MGSVWSAIVNGFQAALAEFVLTIMDVVVYFLILFALILCGYIFGKLIVLCCKCVCKKGSKSYDKLSLAKAV